MRRRLLGLAGRLRADGLAVSVGETLDALAAVAVVGLERDALREALAVTLVKNEDDRGVFDRHFDEAFPVREAKPAPGKGKRGGSQGGVGAAGAMRGGRSGGGEAVGSSSEVRGGQSTRGQGGEAADDQPASSDAARARDAQQTASVASGERSGTADDESRDRAGVSSEPEAHGEREARARGAGSAPPGAVDAFGASMGGIGIGRRDAREASTPRNPVGRSVASDDAAVDPSVRRARARLLRRKPFAAYTADDVADARRVMAELSARLQGRLARRERERRRGRLDLRRTLREAARSGGVPLRLRRRGRRPARPDLVALCDLSGSVAAVSELLLGLVVPASGYFRHVALFGYVDRLHAVSLEDGHLAADGALDLWARSDFGRVLADLWPAQEALLGPGTLLLVLGDARNNRLPLRADLLRAARERVQRLVWLNPEPRARWSTGDSVQHLYAPLCDAVLECTDLDALAAAVRRLV